MTQYQLPISYRCLDRFSILDDDAEGDDGLVSFGDLLATLLTRPVTTLTDAIDVLDTIAHTLYGVSGDFIFLRDFLSKQSWRPFWERIVQGALDLPKLFPEGHLDILVPGETRTFTAVHTTCLIAHQFLCTLKARPERSDDGYIDFSIWFHAAQRHPAAAEAYLTALFQYICSPETEDSSRSVIQYSLHSFSSFRFAEGLPLTQLAVTRVEHLSTDLQEYSLQGQHGAVVVAANKIIGFGQTATQEEIFVGNCPQAAPAVLFTPPLGDETVLVITGAQPILRITGARRDIVWTIAPSRGGRMLFMDALELDNIGTPLPDLENDNVERELRKAATAFSAPGVERVFTGLWGCGAFGGNAAIKLVILWCAASRAGVDLELVTDQVHYANAFTEFVQRAKQFDTEGLLELLENIPQGVEDPIAIVTEWTSRM